MRSFFLIFLMSCGTVTRYYDQQEQRADHGFMVPNRDFQVAVGDTEARTPVFSDREIVESHSKEENFFESELTELENQQTAGLYQQYETVMHKFDSEYEKIYFLKLNSYGEREQYLISKGMVAAPRDRNQGQLDDYYRPQFDSVHLGMRKELVRQHLGSPTQVAVAGDPREENERWGYKVGRQGVTQYIYFENGYVDGWERK